MVKDMPNKFSEVTPEIKELAKKCNKKIDEELFAKYDVKRGLRKDVYKRQPPHSVYVLLYWYLL